MKSDLVILATAAAFYIPAIAYLIHRRHSWTDIVVVGIITTIIAVTVNRFIPPWGAVGYAGLHLLFLGVGGYGVWEERRKSAESK
ncbi:MAG: hypothetical protein M9910_00805 [Kiritimatiellae bacterium]|nr:hypothetical protein [Kiritimatiellia bacterium]